MSYAYGQQQPAYGAPAANNLQFYSSSYGDPAGHSGHSTPSQNYNYGMNSGGFSAGPAGADGARQLSTGLLAAFGTGGYEDEPPLLEELGINFNHIKMKVWHVDFIDDIRTNTML